MFAAVVALAACQSSDSALDPGSGTQAADSGQADTAQPPANDGRILMSEIEGYCPTVTLRDGTSFYTTYEGGASDDATKAIYQASISQVTRSCTRRGGMLNIEVGVAGRIVPGPAGRTGTITMPIRVVLMRGSEVLYSQLHTHQVSVADTGTATQFLFKDPNISIPIPDRKNLQMFAGFDEGTAGR